MTHTHTFKFVYIYIYILHTLNKWESYVCVQTSLDDSDMLMSIGTFMWRQRNTARQTIGVTVFNQIYLHVSNVTYVYLCCLFGQIEFISAVIGSVSVAVRPRVAMWSEQRSGWRR